MRQRGMQRGIAPAGRLLVVSGVPGLATVGAAGLRVRIALRRGFTMPGRVCGIAGTAVIVATAVIAGTATAPANRAWRRPAGRWEVPDERRFAAAEESDPDVSNMLVQLEQIGALRGQGVVTGAGFDPQMVRIVGA